MGHGVFFCNMPDIMLNAAKCSKILRRSLWAQILMHKGCTPCNTAEPLQWAALRTARWGSKGTAPSKRAGGAQRQAASQHQRQQPTDRTTPTRPTATQGQPATPRQAGQQALEKHDLELFSTPYLELFSTPYCAEIRCRSFWRGQV